MGNKGSTFGFGFGFGLGLRALGLSVEALKGFGRFKGIGSKVKGLGFRGTALRATLEGHAARTVIGGLGLGTWRQAASGSETGKSAKVPRTPIPLSSRIDPGLQVGHLSKNTR